MRLALFGLLFSFALPAAAADEDDWGAPPPAARAEPAKVPAAAVRQAQLLKLRANGMYRARKYREARELYAACARLDPGDADARNDLAGCYLKLGRKDSALAAAREALSLAGASLASGDTAAWSFPDLRVRKNAYFVLDKSGAPMTVPKPGRCETWAAAEGECRARLHVCAERGSRAAPEGTSHWDVLRIAVSGPKARFGPDETESPSQLPRPELRDMEVLSIDGVPESESRWVNRDSAATLPLGEFLETADPACSGPSCGSLEKETARCRILHFDACAGVIGLACAYQEEGGPDRVVVGEYYLIPSRR